MAVNLRADERQWLRYHDDEMVGAMRGAEAWSLRVAGAYLTRRSMQPGVPTVAAENMRHIGAILNKISDARMQYLATSDYDTPIESLVGAASFHTVGQYVEGQRIDPTTLVAATDTILAALTQVDIRTGDAGFLHPTRLESVLTRGD